MRGFCLHLAKSACKPGSVSDGCPSQTVIPLGVRLPARSSNLPGNNASRVGAPCLVLLRMGFSLPSVSPRPRCALTGTGCPIRSRRNPPFHPCLCRLPGHRRFCSLFHFPSPRDARPLAGILLCGARTFLPPRTGGDCPADFDAHSNRCRAGRCPYFARPEATVVHPDGPSAYLTEILSNTPPSAKWVCATFAQPPSDWMVNSFTFGNCDAYLAATVLSIGR